MPLSRIGMIEFVTDEKRLSKSDCRETAESLKREITILDADVGLLKIQQKALKRGIIPNELVDKKESA